MQFKWFKQLHLHKFKIMEIFQKINRYIPNQKSLYLLFLLLMMLPSLALSLTEPMNRWVKVASIMFTLAFFMLGLVVFRKPGYVFVFLFFVKLINGYQLVLLYLFNQAVVSPDMFLTIVTSDSGESGELMGLIWPIVLLACVVYFSATILAIYSVFFFDTYREYRLIHLALLLGFSIPVSPMFC